MMSFKRANDATYIAQLLGRMIRTPMQMHIEVDDVLNDVHLYLPYLNEDTVNDIVEALQNSEGGDVYKRQIHTHCLPVSKTTETALVPLRKINRNSSIER